MASPQRLTLAELNKLKDLEEKVKIKEGLPHLFGFNRYVWQQDFIESNNRDCFLVAANQVGKSTCQIIKCITLATDKSRWPGLWQSEPRTFIYLYPSLKLATVEFEEKWLKECLPRNGFENSEEYGFKVEYKQRQIHAIRFNSGVTVYFLSYNQNVSDIQAMTIWAMFCDEELPFNLHPELQARLRATRGQFNMVFTATLGQEEWRQTMEEKGKNEMFPSAFKKQVSLYDCQIFMNGIPSQWTDKRIIEEINRCGTHAEVQRRIFGKFILEGGMKYPSFNRVDNVKPYDHKLPIGWRIYSGVDVGGGGDSHKSAIVFVAVNPDFTQGRVFKCWRGDDGVTTASDVVHKYLELKGNMIISGQYYDWASKDFNTIATRMGCPFLPADKNHTVGTGIINTLFKNNMMFIYDNDQNRKLINELSLARHVQRRGDDLADAFRYAVSSVPWNYSKIRDDKIIMLPKNGILMNERDEYILNKHAGISDQRMEQDLNDKLDIIGGEISDFNDLIGVYDVGY